MKTLVLALFAILIITQFYSCENGDKMSTSVTSNENKEEKSEETKNQKSNEDSISASLSTEKGNIVAENSLQSKETKNQKSNEDSKSDYLSTKKGNIVADNFLQSKKTKNQKSNEDSKSAFLSTENGNIVAENSLQSKKEKPQEGDKVLIDANLETNYKYCATYSWSKSGCDKVVRVDNFCNGTVYFNIRLDNGYCMNYYVNPGAWVTVPINWCGYVYFNWGSCR